MEKTIKVTLSVHGRKQSIMWVTLGDNADIESMKFAIDKEFDAIEKRYENKHSKK